MYQCKCINPNLSLIFIFIFRNQLRGVLEIFKAKEGLLKNTEPESEPEPESSNNSQQTDNGMFLWLLRMKRSPCIFLSPLLSLSLQEKRQTIKRERAVLSTKMHVVPFHRFKVFWIF